MVFYLQFVDLHDAILCPIALKENNSFFWKNPTKWLIWILFFWFGFVLNQIKQTLIDMPWFHHLKLKFGIYCSSIFFVNGLWLKNQKFLFFVGMIHRRYCTLFAILFINFRRFEISHIYFMGLFSILRPQRL